MEEIDCKAEAYHNGELAREIEHLLMMYLHNGNTVAEIEYLKEVFFNNMESMYSAAQFRIEKENVSKGEIKNE